MDQNLEESLNFGSAMGVDFGHEDVVIQSEIPLQQTSSEEIQMDYENTEEHSMLMDTESEEIIVSDYMGDSLSIEYTLSSEHNHDMATLDPNHGLSSQSDTIIDLQYEPQATITAIKPDQQPKIITVKTVTSIPSHIKRSDMGVLKPVPRQIAIAPKPMPTAGSKPMPTAGSKPIPTAGSKPPSQSPKGYGTMGHIAIAPKPSVMSVKPVTLIANRSVATTLKKVSIAGVTHANSKSSSVLAQIGKQLIMVPSGAQKVKLVTSSSVGGVQYITTDSSQAQLIPNKNINVQQNKLLTKLITVQGQSDVDNQPVVITKMMPEGSNKPLPRFVTVQQKPISIANKVLLTTPTKQVTTMAKKHEIIAIHAPNTKIAPAPNTKIAPAPNTKIAPAPNTTAGSNNLTENKVLIPANTAQKMIMKPASSQNTTQIGKKTNYVVDGQTTQLHQINVPGKGYFQPLYKLRRSAQVQYIRLITNPSTSKPANMKPQNIISVPSKTFVLTDDKGNHIQLTAEMMNNGQPPSLVMTNKAKLTKVPQKLVRIAPIAPKTSQASMQSRPSQSLLAPLSPVDSSPVEYHNQKQEVVEEAQEIEEMEEVEVDSKENIRELLEARVVEDMTQEQSSSEQVLPDDVSEQFEHPEQDLIVIPSNYDQIMYHDKYKNHDERADRLTVNVEGAPLTSCPSPAPAVSEADMVSTELGLRPRKACNCTKSQCLKLYCDCFANGEFCNRCNCNNCHNNLDNEELRQKAIRGCLDRNPNAFRPKIGKTKSGGPEIVRRHNKGCNCKRSGCLKNYCECYEAKIACTAMCKCVGCRNVEESLERSMRYELQNKRYSPRRAPAPPADSPVDKQPCAFMTSEVIDAVCQCLVAVAADRERAPGSPVPDVIEEFARCLQDIIGTAYVQPHREGAA